MTSSWPHGCCRAMQAGPGDRLGLHQGCIERRPVGRLGCHLMGKAVVHCCGMEPLMEINEWAQDDGEDWMSCVGPGAVTAW